MPLQYLSILCILRASLTQSLNLKFQWTRGRHRNNTEKPRPITSHTISNSRMSPYQDIHEIMLLVHSPSKSFTLLTLYCLAASCYCYCYRIVIVVIVIVVIVIVLLLFLAVFPKLIRKVLNIHTYIHTYKVFKIPTTSKCIYFKGLKTHTKNRHFHRAVAVTLKKDSVKY